jgi:hypothetical protein
MVQAAALADRLRIALAIFLVHGFATYPVMTRRLAIAKPVAQGSTMVLVGYAEREG